MNKTLIIASLLFTTSLATPQRVCAQAQTVQSVSDTGTKPQYVYSLEEALSKAKRERKPIFFNCYANWVLPCRSMEQFVFTNKEFSDFLNKNFVNLFMEMTSEEGKAIAQRYDIKQFAHYLVLDSEGKVLLRIIGGKKLPDFQQDVALALNPKTTIPGTEAAIAKGKHDKKNLLAFLRVHKLAHDTAAYNKYAPMYWNMLKPTEYTKKENWEVFTHMLKKPQDPLFQYLIDHKSDFEKEQGKDIVNAFTQRLFYDDLSGFAFGSVSYDSNKMLDLYILLQKADLDRKSFANTLYQVGKLRGEGKLKELINYLQTQGDMLEQLRPMLEASLPDMELPDNQKEILAQYLKERAATQNERNKMLLLQAAEKLESKPQEGGMIFEHTDFATTLANAAKQGKLVFMDCYTTWCMPCKFMADRIFPLPQVGEKMNARFLNIKVDMEHDEGVQLAKRYNVSAYPTMLILSPDGKELGRLVGSSTSDKEFLYRVQEVLDKLQ